jgi:hypothetical protein
MTPLPLPEACCARLPAEALLLLADLRARGDVRTRLDGPAVWVHWPAADREVLRRVLALRGAEVFERRGEHWYRAGRSLPSFEVRGEEGARPLAALLMPAAVQPEVCAAAFVPLRMALVRDDHPRPAGALCCSLAELAEWGEKATSRQLAGLQAAWCPAGSVLVLGERLPPLAAGERYWGRSLLVPLGFRADPDLTEDALREALGLGGDVGILTAEGLEVVPRSAFGPLTRAGVRLAVGQVFNLPEP